MDANTRHSDRSALGKGRTVSISYENGAMPVIKWNHVDGPLLVTRAGRIHWLTYWERIQMRFGWTDIFKLERKHWGFNSDDTAGREP